MGIRSTLYAELLEKTPEERIQFIFQTQGDQNDARIKKVGYLLTNDPSPIVRHEAAYVLGQIPSKKSFDMLCYAVQHDPNRFVIHESALALGNLGNITAEPILRSIMNHTDQDIALTAEIAIERLNMKSNSSSITGQDPVKIILDLSTHPEHRIQAAFVLLEIGSLESILTLVNSLKQEINPIVKHEIIFSLGETASKTASDELIGEITRDMNHFVIHEILLALSTLAYPEAVPIIQQYLDHQVNEIRESAEIAMQRISVSGETQ